MGRGNCFTPPFLTSPSPRRTGRGKSEGARIPIYQRCKVSGLVSYERNLSTNIPHLVKWRLGDGSLGWCSRCHLCHGRTLAEISLLPRSDENNRRGHSALG